MFVLYPNSALYIFAPYRVPLLSQFTHLSRSLVCVGAVRAAVLVWVSTAARYPLSASHIDRWAPTSQFQSNDGHLVSPSASLRNAAELELEA